MGGGGIARELQHPLARPVAKVICLLQYVKSVHRTAENIAAALDGSVAADSQLASVKEALRELEATHEVRHGDDGYRSRRRPRTTGSAFETASPPGPATRTGSTPRSCARAARARHG